jgi:hypothetical protein
LLFELLVSGGSMGRALVAIALYLASTAGVFAYGSAVAGSNGNSLSLASANGRVAQDPETHALRAAAPAHNEVAQTAEGPTDSDANVNDPNNWAWLGALFAFFNRYWEVVITLAWFAGAVGAISLLRLLAWFVSAAPRNVLKERALICAWVGLPPAMKFVSFWIGFRGPYSDIAVILLLAWTDAFGALAIGGVVRKQVSKNWKAPAPLSLPLASFIFGTVATVPLLLFWFYGGLTSSSCGVPPFPLLSVCGFLQWQGVYFTAIILLLILLCGAVLPADSNLVTAHHRLGRFVRKSAAAIDASMAPQPPPSETIVISETESKSQTADAPDGVAAAVESFAQAITKTALQPSTPPQAEVPEPVVMTESTSTPLAVVAPKGFAAATEALAQTIKKEEPPMTTPEQAEVATTAVPAPAESPSATLPVSPSAALPVPVPEIPPSRAPQGIVLKLKRSQRSSLTGKVIFILDARVELSSEEVALIRKYRLADDVVYESSARKARQEATVGHLQMTAANKTSYRDSAGAQMLGAGKTFYRLARAGISATAAALSLRVTINSLMSGVHVECKSMGELMEAETAIVEAARGVRDYLDLAETFDGREEVLEF